MRGRSEVIEALLEPVVGGLGYELVAVELLGQQRGALVRVYIDHTDGITLEDCERVSRQAGAVLDVEEPVRGAYVLEVSSPGLDRPLFTPAHFERFAGARARLRLAQPLDGRRQLLGCLGGMHGGKVVIDTDDGRFELGIDQIDRAWLVPETGLPAKRPAGRARER